MAVEKCDGLMVDGRKIMLKLIEDKVEQQDLTSRASQLVNELKSNIIGILARFYAKSRTNSLKRLHKCTCRTSETNFSIFTRTLTQMHIMPFSNAEISSLLIVVLRSI